MIQEYRGYRKELIRFIEFIYIELRLNNCRNHGHNTQYKGHKLSEGEAIINNFKT